MSKAVLVVSFGTSYPETRKKTIDVIENALASSFPDRKIYSAWTSRMIAAKLLSRDGIKIDSTSEAMIRMSNDGVTDVIVQPTHIINGIENNLMTSQALKFSKLFSSVSFGAPLLSSESDNEKIVRIIADNFSYLDPEKEALVLMGHGTDHYSNCVYAALNFRFADMGFKNIFVGTVESYPTVDSVIKAVKAAGLSDVTLAPFMIVAGDHAQNDMAGDSEDSWKSKFQSAGFKVNCVLKGLGEYPEICEIFADHARGAVRINSKDDLINHV